MINLALWLFCLNWQYRLFGLTLCKGLIGVVHDIFGNYVFKSPLSNLRQGKRGFHLYEEFLLLQNKRRYAYGEGTLDNPAIAG